MVYRLILILILFLLIKSGLHNILKPYRIKPLLSPLMCVLSTISFYLGHSILYSILYNMLYTMLYTMLYIILYPILYTILNTILYNILCTIQYSVSLTPLEMQISRNHSNIQHKFQKYIAFLCIVSNNLRKIWMIYILNVPIYPAYYI